MAIKSICVIVKDEQRNLPEWVEYNLTLGFDDIYVFEDYYSTSHRECLNPYPQCHLIKVCDIWRSKAEIPFGVMRNYNAMRTQDAVFWYFLNNYRDRTDWCAFIDPDEFIMTEDGVTLDCLIKEFKDEKGIYLAWRTYNANGYVKRPSLPTIEAYTTYRENTMDNAGWDFKSFVNMHKAECWDNIHKIHDGVNTRGQHSVRDNELLVYDKAWINHYYTKSWEDWVMRLKRGNMNNNLRTIDDFFSLNPDMECLRDGLVSELNLTAEEFPCCSVLSRRDRIYLHKSNLELFRRLNNRRFAK